MEAILRLVFDGDYLEVLPHLEFIVSTELVRELGVGNDQFSVGGLELLEYLGGGVEGVGGGRDSTDHGGTEEGEDEFWAVLEEEHDDIPLLDAKMGEAGGGFPAEEVCFGVGVDFSGGTGDEAGEVSGVGKLLEQVGVEGEVVGDGDIGEP